MRRVCLSCAGAAVRVVCTTSRTRCRGSVTCNEAASVCGDCAERLVTTALSEPLAPVAAALRAMVRGLALIEAREVGAEDYVRGKLEGLETALSLVERASRGRAG